MPKPPINVKVTTVDTELQFSVQKSSGAKALFDQVITTTGIREIWYFGLQFTDVRNQPAWLNLTKRLNQHEIKKEVIQKFAFKFKYFPENVDDEIIQDATLKHLYLQVKDDILNELIYCPAEKAVLLASYQVQCKFLDYDATEHPTGYLANEKLLSKTVIDQHKLSMEEWEEKISSFHKQHKGMSRDQAMIEYLKIAQDLEMFGINYFSVYNVKGTEVLLGVDALGINVYEKNNKLAPKISFPWSEIKKISHSGERFKVRLNDKGSNPFEGKTLEPKTAIKIYDLCSGNHLMYMKRRSPDTLEVQQMREQKRESDRHKAKNREILVREIKAREEMEKSREETLVKYKELQAEMEKYKTDLDEARRTIEDLERQLRELQEARVELETQKDELRDLMTKLEADRDMELEEKQKLEEEIRAKYEEIERVKTTVDEKDEETKKLQEEMADARRQLEETTQSMSQKMEAASEATAVAIEQNEMEANGVDHETSSDAESEHAAELPVPTKEPVDEDREMDVKKEDLLKELRANLEEKKEESKITVEDKQYIQLANSGRDKFKTLRDIRSGNTKRRLDMFENM